MDSDARRRWTLIAAILGLNITILDETVVFLALPAINRDLHLDLNGQQWVVNGYLLSLAALLLTVIGGSMADLFGRRRLFIGGLGAFGLASLACGFAPSGGLLVAFRLVQGAAAAMVMPSTLALLTATFQGDDRGAAIGSWASWGAVAAGAGPLIGGFLIQTLSWRWIFFLSLPLVAVALASGVGAVAESWDESITVRRIDLVGAVLAGLGLGGISYGLVQGPAVGWGQLTVIGPAVIGVAALMAFFVYEKDAPSPLLPLRLFRSRNFSAANATTVALYAVFNGNFFILTIYLQTVLGYSALAAGACGCRELDSIVRRRSRTRE